MSVSEMSENGHLDHLSQQKDFENRPSGRVRRPITAMALTNALGETTEAVLCALFGGQSGLIPCPKERWPLPFETYVGEAKGKLEHLPPSESRFDSRAARLLARPLAEMASQIERAKARWGNERVAIVLGTSTGGIAETENAFASNLCGEGIPASFDFEFQHAFGGLVAFAQARTGALGPAWAISTACSSSGKVLGTAMRLIESGLADAVIAGGADSLCQTTLRGFGSLGVVSASPCRPFCRDRDGLNIGEGAALLLIERECAEAELPKGWLMGVGESADAHHMSHPHPEGEGALRAMRDALLQGGISPEQVSHINAHGTGTQANDAVEGAAIQKLFGTRVPVVSTKAATGHMLGAGGASEAIFALAALERGALPPALRCSPRDDAFDICLPEAPQMGLDLCYALSNSFAFGGSNVSVLVGRVDL